MKPLSSFVRLLLLSALFLGGLLGAANAFPITLTLVPSATVLSPGQGVSVAIVVGGLTNDEQEVALESFDLDLSFGTSRLLFSTLTFGPSLGTVAETFRNGPGTPNTTAVVVMDEFSNLTEGPLLALQNAPFTLATIQFTAKNNPGNVVLQLINLSGSSLGGIGGAALGNQLTAPSSILLTIVPEPSALLLLTAALGLYAGGRRAARG